MKRFLFFWLSLPVILAAAGKLPMGTSGNRLIFTVKNERWQSLKNVQVFICTTPAWIAFDDDVVTIDSIQAGGSVDAVFMFDVLAGEAGRSGMVELNVFTENGWPLAHRKIMFESDLDLAETTLFAPYPNPGNPGTTIQFGLKEPSRVTLVVYNVLGRKVRTLLDDSRPAGLWDVIWDGRNTSGSMVSSGVYVIRLQTGAQDIRRRMIRKVMIRK